MFQGKLQDFMTENQDLQNQLMVKQEDVSK
jgi:hypothetical protein